MRCDDGAIPIEATTGLNFAEIQVNAVFTPNKGNTTETTKVLGASGSTIYESLDFPNRGVKPNLVLANLAAYGIDGTIG